MECSSSFSIRTREGSARAGQRSPCGAPSSAGRAAPGGKEKGKRKAKDFGQSDTAGQRQEQRERSGLPLPSDSAQEPLPPRRIRLHGTEGRLTLTPREVQPL